nr:hypothetical protein [Pseudoxanthomonas winnipegensis]
MLGEGADRSLPHLAQSRHDLGWLVGLRRGQLGFDVADLALRALQFGLGACGDDPCAQGGHDVGVDLARRGQPARDCRGVRRRGLERGLHDALNPLEGRIAEQLLADACQERAFGVGARYAQPAGACSVAAVLVDVARVAASIDHY